MSTDSGTQAAGGKREELAAASSGGEIFETRDEVHAATGIADDRSEQDLKSSLIGEWIPAL